MNFADDFLIQAQACLVKVIQAYRPQLLSAYGNAEHTVKDDDSPVTALDLEMESRLRSGLGQLDGGIGFEGEEHGKAGSDETFWLIDPIDGTANFIRGLPFAYNMATLIDDNEPVYAFVYNFITDELFTARKNKGTFKNSRPIQVSERPINESWLEMSISGFGDRELQPMVTALESKVRRLRVMHNFTAIAEGKIDGHIAYNSMGGAWDYAPRALLVSEAGGRVANIGKDNYHYRNLSLLASNPLIFEELKQVINSAMGVKS